MLIEWPSEFDRQLDRMEADTTEEGVERLHLLLAMLKTLQDLEVQPIEDSASLKRVRQSKAHQVWRVSHPYRPGVAMRLICWFPPDTETVVVALFSGEKSAIGDVFYDSVGSRADQLIERWLQEREGEGA